MSENKTIEYPAFNAVWNDAAEGGMPYTRLSVLALVSACFGIASFLVYFTPWFFFLGVIAISLSLVALIAIRRSDGIVTGTSLAYTGLCSAMIALISVAVFWSAYQYGIRKEADQFFRLWFAAVQAGDIPRAKEFQSIYVNRSRASDTQSWWQEQYDDSFAHRAVHRYVDDPLVRVVMALGIEARITYHKTLFVHSGQESDIVRSVYAVTFESESGVTETFFVQITGQRLYPIGRTGLQNAGWRLEGSPSLYVPTKNQS